MLGLRHLRPLLCALLGALFGTATSAIWAQEAPLQGLIARSPFGAATADGRITTPEATPLEFHGVVVEGTERMFSVYETATHRTCWLHENEVAGKIAVSRYDDGTGLLNVSYLGRPLCLPIKGGQKYAVQKPRTASDGTIDPNQSITSGVAPPELRLAREAEVARRNVIYRSYQEKSQKEPEARQKITP